MQNFTTDNLMVAIDLGTSRICGVVGKKDYNGCVEIIAFESEVSKGIKRGAVSNPEAAAFCIKNVLTYLQNKVNVSLNEGVPDEKKKIYEITGAYVGLNGHKISAGGQDLKNNLHECFKNTGREINGIVLSPIATASAVLSEEEKESGCVMIDFGAGTTSVALYHEKALRHFSVIPFGGNTITNDIMDLKVSELTAEDIKVEHGSAMEELAKNFHIPVEIEDGKDGESVPNKLLAGIIETRIDEIFDYVCDQVDKSGFADSVKTIVITGGGAQLRDLAEKLKQRTGLSVRIGIPNQKANSNMDKKYLKTEYAQLIGLLFHAEKDCVREKATVQQNPATESEKNKNSGAGTKPIKKRWGNLFDTMFTDKEFTDEKPEDEETTDKKKNKKI